MLTFEVAGAVYGLPIDSVLEVAEASGITCVPSLPGAFGGVMNWHGDALPIVASRLLLVEAGRGHDSAPVSGEAADERISVREHVLVVSDRRDDSARMGIPIDRVLGLVDGVTVRGRPQGLVVERRPVDGRVVSVLDPRRLVERAEQVIEEAVG
jgi:chemotaxis signal transduction protein